MKQNVKQKQKKSLDRALQDERSEETVLKKHKNPDERRCSWLVIVDCVVYLFP